jgi:hypothetical protein
VDKLTSWEIEYYRTAAGTVPVAEFIDALSPQVKAKFIRSLELLEEYGLLLREPWVKEYPWYSQAEGAEIHFVWRDLPCPLLSRGREKLDSPSRIQEEIPGNAEAGTSNGRSPNERLHSTARR